MSNTNQYIMYVTVALLLLISSLSPVQHGVATLFHQAESTVWTSLFLTLILFLAYILVKFLVNKFGGKSTSEPFFFEVTSYYKCTGLYKGKPNSFQYSNFYDHKKCKDTPAENLGFINQNKSNVARNPNPQKANPYFGGSIENPGNL